MNGERLKTFETIVAGRSSVRSFLPEPLPEGLLARLLDSARRAPSGWNLQPTHFVTVEDRADREALSAACMGQRQVAEAPAVVVFCGDLRARENHFEKMLAAEHAAGSITGEYEAVMRRFVPLAFDRGPFGAGWLWKASLGPILRLFVPVPDFPAVHMRAWLSKQSMLCAMTFMLAAEAAGLATVPMEGFDERRIRRALAMPGHIVPLLVVPIGFAAPSDTPRRTRLPLTELLHTERW